MKVKRPKLANNKDKYLLTLYLPNRRQKEVYPYYIRREEPTSTVPAALMVLIVAEISGPYFIPSKSYKIPIKDIPEKVLKKAKGIISHRLYHILK